MPNADLFLDELWAEDVLKTPSFFNGRLLTQEDLTQEQGAQRARRLHLGRALGAGIASGLEVVPDLAMTTTGDLVLAVAGGLAVAPDGTTLHLEDLVHLHFNLRPEAAAASGGSPDSDFHDCGAVTASVSVGTSGLHLLVLRPAEGVTGLAPVSGLGNEVAPCNTKYRTAGVSFRALAVDPGIDPSTTTDRKRSAIARACFGFFEPTLLNLMASPFVGPAPLEIAVAPAAGAQPAPGYGLIDALRQSGELCACEVPLALVRLQDNGSLDYVDLWPVRRALVRPGLTRRWWPFGGTDGRRRAEAEASMLCFQDHVAAMLGGTSLSTVRAVDRFAFLPGGGFLPTAPGQFNASTFLGPTAVGVFDEDFGRLRTLVEESWSCDPFDPALAAVPPLSFYVFSQAAGQWVFFLRRRKDVVEVVAEEGEDETEAAPAVRLGAILVLVLKSWIDQHGEPALAMTRVAGGAGPALDEIDETEAKKFLKDAQLATVFEERVGKKVFGTSPKPTLTKDQLKGARFFGADKVPVGRYRLRVAGHRLGKSFDEVVTISAGGVQPVLVS